VSCHEVEGVRERPHTASESEGSTGGTHFTARSVTAHHTTDALAGVSVVTRGGARRTGIRMTPSGLGKGSPLRVAQMDVAEALALSERQYDEFCITLRRRVRVHTVCVLLLAAPSLSW
jgi:hypothetical protein